MITKFVDESYGKQISSKTDDAKYINAHLYLYGVRHTLIYVSLSFFQNTSHNVHIEYQVEVNKVMTPEELDMSAGVSKVMTPAGFDKNKEAAQSAEQSKDCLFVFCLGLT